MFESILVDISIVLKITIFFSSGYASYRIASPKYANSKTSLENKVDRPMVSFIAYLYLCVLLFAIPLTPDNIFIQLPVAIATVSSAIVMKVHEGNIASFLKSHSIFKSILEFKT